MSDTEYAKGGGQLGRTRDFTKEEDRFRGRPNPPVVKTDDNFGKEGGKQTVSPPCHEPKDGKVLPTVMPRC